MTSNQFEAEIKYRLALLILYNLLKDEIVTKDECSFILPLSSFLTSCKTDTKANYRS